VRPEDPKGSRVRVSIIHLKKEPADGFPCRQEGSILSGAVLHASSPKPLFEAGHGQTPLVVLQVGRMLEPGR
jgi:hypothetical protein